MAPYPAKNTTEASELLIDVSNQLHEIVNESATSEISTDSGLVPSVRKALADTFLFQQPIPWEQGQTETAFNQLRTFGTNLYWAPSATSSNPISMGATPEGDDNWPLAPTRIDKSSILSGLGKTNKGYWDENPTLENSDEFVVYRNTGDCFGAITTPYTVDSASHLNPEDLLGVELADVSDFAVQEDITESQNDLVGGSIFKGSNGETVEVGDTVPAGTTHLRVLIGGEPTLFAMSPVASGVVSSITSSGATIGGKLVSFSQPLIFNFDSVSDMLGAKTKVGFKYAVGQTIYKKVSETSGDIYDFVPLKDLSINDFAKGGLVANNTVAIQEAINYATANNLRLTGQGAFICDEIHITCDCDLSGVYLIHSGSPSGAHVTVGYENLDYLRNVCVSLPRIYSGNNDSTTWDAGSIGVMLRNVQESTITVKRITQYETGFGILGDGKGCSYNTINMNWLENNKVNFEEDSINNGWSNENLIIGGRYQHYSSVLGQPDLWQIQVLTGDGLVFMKPSIEESTGAGQQAQLINCFGSSNKFLNVRWESTSGIIRFDSTDNGTSSGVDNYVSGTFGGFSIEVEELNGARFNEVDRGVRFGFSRSSQYANTYRNESDDNNPVIRIVDSSTDINDYQNDGQYNLALSARKLKAKRTNDTEPRVMLDYTSGYLYHGNGASAPVEALPTYALSATITADGNNNLLRKSNGENFILSEGTTVIEVMVAITNSDGSLYGVQKGEFVVHKGTTTSVVSSNVTGSNNLTGDFVLDVFASGSTFIPRVYASHTGAPDFNLSGFVRTNRY